MEIQCKDKVLTKATLLEVNSKIETGEGSKYKYQTSGDLYEYFDGKSLKELILK